MFESLEERVVGYATDDILKAAAETLRAKVEAENALLAWTAAWADANSADSIHPDELALPGGPRGVRPGGEGTPEVHDLALEELAVKIKKSDYACMKFVGEVLDLRHRLPLLWEKTMRCEVEGWQARSIARQTHDLTLEMALQVDEELAGVAGLVGQQKLQNLTEAAMARVDGPRLEREAAERKKQLGVWLSQTNDEGLKGLFARLQPPDAVRLFGRIQELADALPPDGRTPDERRAAGLALLANELEASRLLAEYRQPDLFGEAFAEAVLPVDGEDEHEPLEESELHPSLRDQPAKIIDTEADAKAAVFKAAVEQIVAKLDPALLVPTSTLIVHIAAETLAGEHGICRVPGIGPVLKGVVKDWLGHDRVKVVPVINLNDTPAPVDDYQIPPRHKRYLRFARPGSRFPWSTATGRLEFDHTQPYRSAGPPGQTDIAKLTPLAKREHRAVTFGGWQRRQPEPDTMIFKSPHGDVQITNYSGTFDLGHGPFAHAVWTAADPIT
ncbi:DUF222 domain-containing protein [Microlunatus parietis]|uniref:DUF222 domain-containing protein n=1 Tax=Microlunatus parietis TaxID=682979 RepID=A0A7Y9I2V4_9ACTN|nr:DUF222 domain-containing protein [Microlunatus parietis]NYE69206.1 hypothetical protein [Microlunatus parietis]